MANGKRKVTQEKKYESIQKWRAEGTRLFGERPEDWRFKCPKCGNVATGQDFKNAGAEAGVMAEECIGRYVKGKGCDWTAYGLFDICNVHVFNGDELIPVFEFAEQEENHEN